MTVPVINVTQYGQDASTIKSTAILQYFEDYPSGVVEVTQKVISAGIAKFKLPLELNDFKLATGNSNYLHPYTVSIPEFVSNLNEVNVGDQITVLDPDTFQPITIILTQEQKDKNMFVFFRFALS